MSVDRFAGLSHDGTSRLFIALPLSDAAREELDSVQRVLRHNCWPVKWVKPDLAHMTLKFLGVTDHKLVPGIVDALGNVANRHRAVLLRTGRCGAFPSLNRPQVLWLGVDGNVDAAVALASNVDASMIEAGLAPERRPFRPHITLGRVRRGEQLSSDAGRLIQRVRVTHAPLEIDRFQLVRSVLGSSGPTYTTLAEWQLGSVAANQVELVEHG